ncbi:MAG TPA: Hpt domain-containing protein [Thermoanaerobaculia bacterium]|nr:Hpt domain-containing protein [Thermoanaerobaculia bacterium]
MPIPARLFDPAATTRSLEPDEELGPILREILVNGRRRFHDHLSEKIRAIEEACRVVASDGAGPEAVAILRCHVHRLAGSGAMFGFAGLSEASIDFEDFLARLRVPVTPQMAERLAEHMRGLRRALAESGARESGEIVAMTAGEPVGDLQVPARSRGA